MLRLQWRSHTDTDAFLCRCYDIAAPTIRDSSALVALGAQAAKGDAVPHLGERGAWVSRANMLRKAQETVGSPMAAVADSSVQTPSTPPSAPTAASV